MTPSEIIMADATKHGKDPKTAVLAVHELMRRKLGFVLSTPKSVLVLCRINDDDYEVHLYSEGSPLEISKAMLKFYEDIKKIKIKTLYGEADNPQIINLLKQLAAREGTEILNPDRPNYNWMMHV